MLARLLDLRPGEARRVFPMFALLGLVIATSYVLKPVRSALFLSQFGAERLPYVYILVALVLGVVATLFARFAQNVDLPRLFSGLAALFALNLAVFWLLVVTDSRFVGYSFYVWVSIFTALMPSLFWLLANYVFYANEGRRLFPLVMAGGLLGSIVGGALTSISVGTVGTPGLLLGAAGLLVGAAVLVRRIAGRERDRINERGADLVRQERRRPEPARESPLRGIARSRHLSMIAGLVLVTGITSILVDYQFNSVVEHAFETRDELTAFFGGFFALINVAAFFVQLFLAGRILSSLGVAVGLVILPLGLGLSSLAFVLFPSLLTAALVKAVDDGTSNSLNRASVEVLYLPVPLAAKNRLKAWIDMFVERVSRGVSGLLILGATSLLALGVRELSIAVLLLLVPWILLVLALRKEYVATFQRSLARRDIEDLAASLGDPESLEVFRQVLAGEDGKQIRYALELLQGTEDPVLLDEVSRLTSHDSSPVRSAALRVLRSAASPAAPVDLAVRVRDEDAEVAAEALALWLQRDPSRGEEAFAALVAGGDAARTFSVLSRLEATEALLPPALLERIVGENRESESPVHRKLAARAIAFLPPDPALERHLLSLLRDSEIEVARAAAASAGAHRSEEVFSELVRGLGRRPLRLQSRSTLARFGGDAIDDLERLFRDESLPAEVRVALPGAVAAILDQRSVEALLRTLPDTDRRFHYQAIKSLSRLRSRAPSLRFPRAPVERLLEHESAASIELARHAETLSTRAPSKGAFRLLGQVLDERIDFARERIFRLLGLIYPQSEIAGLWIRIVSGRPTVRAAALEYMANLMSRRHRATVMPAIESTGYAGSKRGAVEASLARLARVEDTWLAACALAAIGELRVASLTAVLESALTHRDRVVREVAERALEATSGP
jgi:AAA family ATP:ADP antiporter